MASVVTAANHSRKTNKFGLARICDGFQETGTRDAAPAANREAIPDTLSPKNKIQVDNTGALKSGHSNAI